MSLPLPGMPIRWFPSAHRKGFTILESLVMLVLLTVLGITTLAIYRKGPPPGGWFALEDTKLITERPPPLQNEDSVEKAPPTLPRPACP